jgi:spore germination protein
MSAKIALITEFGLAGGGIWQIMNYFPGLWMAVDSRFTIIKV